MCILQQYSFIINSSYGVWEQRNTTVYHVYNKSLQRWNVRLRPLAVFQVTPLLKSVDDLQFSSSAYMEDVCSGFRRSDRVHFTLEDRCWRSAHVDECDR